MQYPSLNIKNYTPDLLHALEVGAESPVATEDLLIN